ncbi:PQQ-binding-like beta-propeller repeat protein [Streptomyces olivochromogenes]|uniref:outer membrane protein assembly factor BamB family protein n=1 Tax=Streptomyces olivochromogenes TaxID=1963 RepID=UPI0036DBBBCB
MYTQSALTADGIEKKRRRKLFGGVAALLIGALCAGSWLLWHGDDASAGAAGKPAAPSEQGPLDIRETVEKRPANVAGRMAFRFSADDMQAGESHAMPGMWATDKILAKGINRTLVGFKIGTDARAGDEVWNIKFPGPICGTTRHVTAGDRTAVLFRSGTGSRAVCDRVAFVGLDTGKKLWEARFSTQKAAYADATPSVTMSRATVAVAWGGGTRAYDMDQGKSLWTNTPADGCRDRGLAGGRALLVRTDCFDAKTTATTYRIRKVDSLTGKVNWTYQVAKGVKDVNLVSAEPAVLAVAAGDVEITDLISLDEHGKYRATIRVEGGHYVAKCVDEVDYGAVDDCPSMVVGDGQVFLMSREDPDGTIVNNSNWVIGFDLATGKTVKKFESGKDQLLYPLRMSGDQLLALRESSDHITPMALVSLNPRTGKETPYFYFDLPSEAWTLTDQELNDIIVQNGRIFFGAKQANGPANAKEKAWEWLVLGVGSAG